MKSYLTILLIGSCILLSCALPVTKTKQENKEASTSEAPNVEINLEYERYLKEVVELLEEDKEFQQKLLNSPAADIRNGKIAQELEYVNHNIRSKLDEIKRRELERLRSLANQKFEMDNEIDRDHLKVHQHLDHENQHTFEVEDLKRLIKKTTDDLAEADRKRQEEFKEYEMQKEFERKMIKNELDEEQKKKFDEEQKKLKESYKKHEKIHHPGNRAQLEEVWEKQDHMDKQDFNAKTFFMLHDVDGNGYLDETEVKALFVKELDKIYKSGLPDTDMRERAEEMERMREHFFKETDTNKDDLISFDEFLEDTKKEEYQQDEGWKTINEQPQYTHEEYLEFERRRKEEVDRMIAQGLLPAHPNMPQGYYAHNPNVEYQTGHHQQPPNYQQHPQMHYQNPQQQHIQQQQQYQQQQQQYYQQQQPVQLNPNQVYQQIPAQQQQQFQQQQYQQQQPQQQYNQHVPQPQPAMNSLPPQQQQQQPVVNNVAAAKPVASNTITQPQSVSNNIPSAQQLPATNNVPQQQQQQPINNVAPQQPYQNVQQQQNIPHKN